MEGGLQELEESDYWIELLEETSLAPAHRLAPLKLEVNQLIAVFVTIIKRTEEKTNRKAI